MFTGNRIFALFSLLNMNHIVFVNDRDRFIIQPAKMATVRLTHQTEIREEESDRVCPLAHFEIVDIE